MRTRDRLKAEELPGEGDILAGYGAGLFEGQKEWKAVADRPAGVKVQQMKRNC